MSLGPTRSKVTQGSGALINACGIKQRGDKERGLNSTHTPALFLLLVLLYLGLYSLNSLQMLHGETRKCWTVLAEAGDRLSEAQGGSPSSPLPHSRCPGQLKPGTKLTCLGDTRFNVRTGQVIPRHMLLVHTGWVTLFTCGCCFLVEFWC